MWRQWLGSSSAGHVPTPYLLQPCPPYLLLPPWPQPGTACCGLRPSSCPYRYCLLLPLPLPPVLLAAAAALLATGGCHCPSCHCLLLPLPSFFLSAATAPHATCRSSYSPRATAAIRSSRPSSLLSPIPHPLSPPPTPACVRAPPPPGLPSRCLTKDNAYVRAPSPPPCPPGVAALHRVVPD